MPQEKDLEKQLELLRSQLQEGKVVLGTKRALKELRQGKLQEILLARNCPESIKKEIGYYAKLRGVKVVQLSQTNEELGIFCKKNFFVSVLAVIGE
ncbi:ribosomal L7Ae/L30e/S12e/Gadd45 family protein [Candidatus Woesearchaeota archaeon]|nr:ribosomal L7Ae/L30e/S12e/Gadd45 family protein [Candidatus Woesearchaeota archaeon]